ncbi:hypothetical protein BH09BAC5_BH09BAC5_04800 [soil metagenome]
MKKILAFAAVAGMAALVSCGGAADAAAALQDSINKADSMARIQFTADSMHMADSISAANEAAMMKAKEDSTKMADSMAKMADPKKKK